MDDIESYRSGLVPKWIRVFSWIFLVGGALAPLTLVIGLLYRKPMQFGVYGWGQAGSPYEPLSLLVIGYFVLCGGAAFGLLKGKRWGWNLAFLVGAIGLVLSLTSPFAAPPGKLRLPLEPIALLPFLVVLWRLHDRWHNAPKARLDETAAA